VSATAGRVQPLRGPLGDRTRAVIDGTELSAVAIRLLQVVADDLLHLSKSIADLALEPVREALVELRAQPLDQ
jgi:hypothetical protein